MDDLTTKLADALRELLNPFGDVHDGHSKQLDKGREALSLYEQARAQPIPLGGAASLYDALTGSPDGLPAPDPKADAVTVAAARGVVLGWLNSDPAATPAPADRVPVPTNADQAAAMALLGEAWLRSNAPERLRAATPAPAPTDKQLLAEAEFAESYDASAPSFMSLLRDDAVVGDFQRRLLICMRAAVRLAAPEGQGKETPQ